VLGKILATTNEEEWIECVSCRNCCPSFFLHTKTNASAGYKMTASEKQQNAEENIENFVHCKLD
jgi:Na+-translocating ferredoxin:NAD+ oxidoreductase RnfC subunit